MVTLDTCWDFHQKKLFVIPLRLKDFWIWSMTFTTFFIYCDLIQSQYVGDALVPLLRIVPVEGKVGERVSKSFLRPQYLPVSRKQFETVEVDIKTDTGESVPSEFGRVLLTLHFRQSAPQYF